MVPRTHLQGEEFMTPNIILGFIPEKRKLDESLQKDFIKCLKMVYVKVKLKPLMDENRQTVTNF